jgi:two-component system, OmpR family, response regulator MprA
MLYCSIGQKQTRVGTTAGIQEGLPTAKDLPAEIGGPVMKSHILIVDDDPRVTDLVRRILAYEGYSVAIASSGNDALTRTLERPPDLIVLDFMLPGIDGLEVVRRLRAAGDNMPILMLTARDAVTDRVEGLETGADDYLVKPFAPEELLARVKALLRRNQEERHEVLRYVDVELDTGTRVAHRGAREIELSPTEYELLALFLRRPRQVLTREIILDRVWGIDFEGSSNVMEVYVGYLRAKLEAEGESRLIHTVRGVGYVFKE